MARRTGGGKRLAVAGDRCGARYRPCGPADHQRGRRGDRAGLADSRLALPGDRRTAGEAATGNHVRRSAFRATYAGVYQQRAIARLCATAGRDAERFRTAALAVGGRAAIDGDAAFDFDVFPQLSVRAIWYAADAEFPRRPRSCCRGTSKPTCASRTSSSSPNASSRARRARVVNGVVRPRGPVSNRPMPARPPDDLKSGPTRRLEKSFYVCTLLDPHRADLRLGDLRHRVERGVGQDVGGRFGEMERHRDRCPADRRRSRWRGRSASRGATRTRTIWPSAISSREASCGMDAQQFAAVELLQARPRAASSCPCDSGRGCGRSSTAAGIRRPAVRPAACTPAA